MTQDEAKSRVRAFVLANTKVDADPDWIRPLNSSGGPKVWRAFYSAEHFYVREIAAGAVIDGGEYILDVDDQNGVVSVFA